MRQVLILLTAALCLIAATTAAQADPISALILGFIGIEATATAIGITTFILSLAASAGLSYLAQALRPKPQLPDITSLPGGTTGKMQTGGIVPRAFGVGRYMTAGSLVYANTYSPSAASTAAGTLSFPFGGSGNTPNAYLVQVIALSDIPVTGLVGLFVDGKAATYDPLATPSFEGTPIPEFNKSGKDHLWVRFYDGTQVAVDAALVELFGTDPDRPYESTRLGTGVAYAVVTALVNRDLFPSFPQLKFILDGVKFYDRRYDTTAGGSGSQRWVSPATWALTKNPIVIAENILRGISYGGTWLYGAQTVTEAQLPAASWMAAASECDTAIDLADGGTEPQFEASGEIRLDLEPANTLEELLKACNGRMAEIGGVYKVRAGAPGAAVFSFTDADILSTEQQTFDPFPSLGQTINAVKAKYISPAEGWVPKDAPPLYDVALETADGGRRLPVDINYSFVTSGTRVQRLMKSARDTHRAMRTHALPMPPEAFVLEPLDVISWTSTRNGYSSKLFDIETAEDLPNFNTGLATREIDPNAYDWTPGTDEQPVTDGTIINNRPSSQPIVDFAAVPWVVGSDGLQSTPGIKLSWNAATDDVNGIAIEIRRASDSEVICSLTIIDADVFARGWEIVSQNLIFSTAYQARGRYIPISARDTSWSGWKNVTTLNIKTNVTALDDALNRHVTTLLAEAQAAVDEAKNLIASLAAEQDAANWIDRKETRSVISAQYDSAYAAIVDERVLRVAQDFALAGSIDAVSVAINGKSATVTITIASPGVVTWTAHGFGAGRRVKFTTTGTLPTGITANTYYYVLSADLAPDTFRISANAEGTAINTSGSQSGTHTGTAAATNGSVEIEAVTRATNDTALSGLIDNVSAAVNDVSANSTFRALASAGSGGADALIELQVRASVGASFASAGVQIAAFAGGGTPYSRLRFYADKTEIGIPGATGGDYFAPFGIRNVQGVPQVSINPDAMPDYGITQRMIAEGVGGVTYLATASDVTSTDWNVSGAGRQLISTTLNLVAGINLDIHFESLINGSVSDGATSSWVKLKVGGSVVRTISFAPIPIVNVTGAGNYFSFDEIIQNITGGSTTIEVWLYYNASGQSRTVAAPRMKIRELPKVVVVDASVTPSISYRTTVDNGSSLTASGVDIGSAETYRNVVVGVRWTGANLTPSLTIGGASATLVTWIQDAYGASIHAALFALRVTSGTTADLVFSNGGTINNIGFTVWKVVAASATPVSYARSRTTSEGDHYFINLWDNGASVGEVAVGLAYGATASFSTITMSGESPTNRSNTSAGGYYYDAFDLVRATSGSKYFNVASSSGSEQGIVGVTARWR